MTRKAKIRLHDRGSHFLGEVEMPMRGGGRIIASTLGWNPASALKRAASTAMRISTDPAIAPFIPPPVALAAQVARSVAKMSAPQLRSTARSGRGTEKAIATKLFGLRRRASPQAPAATAQQQPYQQPYPQQPQQQPQYDPNSQYSDPATQMAMQAWGEGGFAQGAFPESEAYEPRDEYDSPTDEDGSPMDEDYDEVYDQADYEYDEE